MTLGWTLKKAGVDILALSTLGGGGAALLSGVTDRNSELTLYESLLLTGIVTGVFTGTSLIMLGCWLDSRQNTVPQPAISL